MNPRKHNGRIGLRPSRATLRALEDLAERLNAPSSAQVALLLIEAGIEWVNDTRPAPPFPSKLADMRGRLGNRTRQAAVIDRLEGICARLEKKLATGKK